MACVPQRFLANNRNLVADAILTPSNVQAVANSVVETIRARHGTAQLKITGSYTGLEDATYDFQITDADASGVKLVSAPVANIAGSESLTSIVATTVAPQKFTVECHSAGIPASAAAVDIEGVSVVARVAGTGGNAIHIGVDTSGLLYGATVYSLIEDVKKGAGSDSAPLDGPQFDFGAGTVGADDVIPPGAPRLAFEGDRQTVYVQYKKYVDGGWKYYFVPQLQNDYPATTKILSVSGTYAVTIDDGATPETLSGIVTVYDFLNAVKTTSVLCDVAGVIANDRGPTGQAARDFPVRTTARALLSTGEGSKAAKGFVDVLVEPDANTELVTAECIAIDFKLDPFAHVGHEAWDLAGSVSGALGKIYTDEPFIGATFSLRIPPKLPPTSNTESAQFSMTAVSLQGTSKPDVCFFGKLGPNAVDKTLTLTYTQLKSTGCACDGMPLPVLDGPCLGTTGTGGTDVTYSPEAQTRVDALFDWGRDLAAAVTSYVAGKDIPPVGASVTPATTAESSETASLAGGNGRVTYTASQTAANAGFPVVVMRPSEPVDTGWADVGLPSNFSDLIDYYLDGIEAIDAVLDTSLRAAGFTAWDDALTAWEADLDTSALSSLGNRLASLAVDKYKTLVKRAAGRAGVRLKKADASSVVSGDGCWQDFGGDFWTVVGSDGVTYAPMFTNHAYWLSRKIAVNGVEAYYSTHEAGFIINTACPQLLTYGDTITLTIGNTGALGTYQVGDVLKLPLIAAADLFLTGGVDASLVQMWYVTGSVDGAFAVYTFDPGSPAAYSDGGIAFLLVMGGVAPVAGDSFTFVVEGAHFEWRKNGGSWISSIPVPDGPAVFDDGLSYEFIRGASPSFVTGDMWTFRALQPWAVSNLQSPNRARWYPGVAASDVLVVFDAIKTLDAVGIALHTIPQGATITLEGGDVIGVTDWTETITWQAGAIVKFFDPVHTGIWVRLVLTGAAGASIGWLWVGVAMQTSLAANVSLQRNYRLERGSAGGLYQGGAFLGKSVGGSVQWTEGALIEADVPLLTDTLDHVKTNDDEPLIFVPNFTRPEDTLLAQVVEDNIEIPDVFNYHPNNTAARRLSARISLQGVWG